VPSQYEPDDEKLPAKRPKGEIGKRKRKLSSEDCPKSESEKLKEAAVDCDWVLQKKGAYGQLCRKPGEVIEGAIHSKSLKTSKNKMVRGVLLLFVIYSVLGQIYILYTFK
jgi:hypothetical protein